MKHNVGGWDRAIRSVMMVGSIAATLSPKIGPGWRRMAMILAGLELFTVATRYCPMNEAMGVNTAAKQSTGS